MDLYGSVFIINTKQQTLASVLEIIASVAGPISMSTPQMNLCEWEQPKQ